MPDYYPTYLNLAGKKCVILGGGVVAQGKIAGFRDAGAVITIISPDATTGIQRAAKNGQVRWLEREYQPGDLEGAFIAVAATNVWHVNREIYDEAERLGVLLNVVDDPDLCTFIAPSVVKRDPVTLAISTGGASPALARKRNPLFLIPEQRRELACQREGVQTFLQREGRSDSSHDTGFSREAGALPNPEDGFDSSAVRSEKMLETHIPQPGGGPLQMLIVGFQKVKPSEGCMNRRRPNHGTCVLERVDDAGVAAPRQHDEALAGVQDE